NPIWRSVSSLFGVLRSSPLLDGERLPKPVKRCRHCAGGVLPCDVKILSADATQNPKRRRTPHSRRGYPFSGDTTQQHRPLADMTVLRLVAGRRRRIKFAPLAAACGLQSCESVCPISSGGLRRLCQRPPSPAISSAQQGDYEMRRILFIVFATGLGIG